MKKFDKFHKEFPIDGIVYLEDSVLWYCIDLDVDYYLGLNVHERINMKYSYYNPCNSF